MPIVPDEWDLESPHSRFSLRPALGFLTGEEVEVTEEYRHGARAVVESHVGAWILDEQPGLGVGRAEDGGLGRGASAWIPVVQWVTSLAVAGVIGNAAWAGAAAVVRRLRSEGRIRFYVSRGMAAAVAADHVAREFADAGPFVLEAADEPSGLGGQPAHELAYVGIEPWIVLLRGVGDANRYTVVVEADGRVSGALQTPIDELFRHYQAGPIRSNPPKHRSLRRSLFRRRT